MSPGSSGRSVRYGAGVSLMLISCVWCIISGPRGVSPVVGGIASRYYLNPCPTPTHRLPYLPDRRPGLSPRSAGLPIPVRVLTNIAIRWAVRSFRLSPFSARRIVSIDSPVALETSNRVKFFSRRSFLSFAESMLPPFAANINQRDTKVNRKIRINSRGRLRAASRPVSEETGGILYLTLVILLAYPCRTLVRPAFGHPRYPRCHSPVFLNRLQSARRLFDVAGPYPLRW